MRYLGRAKVLTAQASAGPGLLISAPGPGLRVRLLSVATTGTGGTLRFLDSNALVVRINMDSGASTRPYPVYFGTQSEGGVAFGENEGVLTSGAAVFAMTVTYVVEAAP